MLDQRILTAVLLAPLVVGAVLLLPTPYLALLFGAVVLLAALEWERLCGLGPLWLKALHLAAVGAAMWGVLLLVRPPSHGLWLFAGALLWWVLIALALTRIRVARPGGREPDLLQGLAAFPVLVPAWAAFVVLHASEPAGPALVLFLLFTIWVSDSAAFFAGRRWGRARLAPSLSPGKTWAGLYGALAGSALCAGLLVWWAPDARLAPWMALALCWAATLASVVGDLFESLMKRRCGVKDSGRLLPGHGGVLDRIDSLTAAAPVFTLGWLLAGPPG
ncbi:MAG: phosphatidate cytidylyltransferase [Chromatiales bacterium]